MKTTPLVWLLVVEDDETDFLLLKEALAEIEGFEYAMVHSQRLAEALERCGERLFDAVLLDLGLPDSTGLETFARFRQQVSDIPVLVLTALEDESVGVSAMKLGAQDYLIKNEIHPVLLGRTIRYAIERQRSTAELLRSRQQLRQLTARLQEVREAERTRIAREIHDELGQSLTALKMDLRWIERKLSREESSENLAVVSEKVSEAKGLADGTIEMVQRIALELRPSVLDSLGLIEAIRDEARRFEARINVELVMALPEQLAELDADTVTAVFRIFQELLTNVARHADARVVKVSLSEDSDNLELIVDDDGKGFSSDLFGRPTSLGLLGMSERAISLNGWIRFDGTEGHGTRAVLRVPIEHGEFK